MENTPWHTVLGQQINHVIFLWMAGSMFVAAAVLLAPMFAQRCNVIHTLQQDMDTLLYFHFTELSLHYNKTWTHFYTSISLNCHYSGNDETIMFHMITTTHLHCSITRDAHPMRGEVTHIPLHAINENSLYTLYNTQSVVSEFSSLLDAVSSFKDQWVDGY